MPHGKSSGDRARDRVRVERFLLAKAGGASSTMEAETILDTAQQKKPMKILDTIFGRSMSQRLHSVTQLFCIYLSQPINMFGRKLSELKGDRSMLCHIFAYISNDESS